MGGGAFERKMRRHFATKLEVALSCDDTEHHLCYVNELGEHHQLCEKEFATWVLALCEGYATLAKPPQNLALCSTGENLSALSSLIQPNPSIMLSASYSSECCPTESSGVPGPGYLTGKAMKWLGQVSLRGLQEAVLLARLWRYNRLVTTWRTQNNLIMCVKNEKEIYNVLGDMLELSNGDYPERIQTRALQTLDKIFTCSPLSFGPLQVSIWLCEFLTIMRTNPFAPRSIIDQMEEDIARVPLALQGTYGAAQFILGVCYYLMHKSMPETEREETTRELFAWRTARILSDSEFRRQLTSRELNVLRSLAKTAKERYPCTAASLRPSWFQEMDIFIICAGRDPWFLETLSGPTGVQFLLQHLSWCLSRRRPLDVELAYLLDRLNNNKVLCSVKELRYACICTMLRIIKFNAEKLEESRVLYLAICILRNILLSDVDNAFHTLDRLMEVENRLLLEKVASRWSSKPFNATPYGTLIIHNVTAFLDRMTWLATTYAAVLQLTS